MNDVQIFYDNYLKEHALGNRIKTHLFHRGLHAYDELIACLTSIKNDKNFVDKMNGIDKVEVPKYQARQLPEYDVFISPQRQRHFHGNADRAYRFRKFDVTKREQRQRLIDSFVNAVYLYEDKIILTFNYKDGSKTITLAEVEGSDLSTVLKY